MELPTVGVMLRSWDLRLAVTASEVLDAARRAEALGLEAVLAGDHLTFHGYGNDALITLTAVAAVTERVELETSVYLLPLRHPVLVALQAAQLDQLSLGRLVLGVGVGGEDPHEFTSAGIDPATRGARANETLRILRALWEDDDVSFAGRHYVLDAVSVNPKPVRAIPLLVGGRSDAALRRAGRYGDGYTGIWLSPERFAAATAGIRRVAGDAGRDARALSMGMQFWTAVSPTREEARALVSERMEGTYRLPFERFERYTPYGTAQAVAAAILPYVLAGACRINLIPVQDSLAESVERAAEIRAALHALVGREASRA